VTDFYSKTGEVVLGGSVAASFHLGGSVAAVSFHIDRLQYCVCLSGGPFLGLYQ
jgi:hypothetical protein